MLTRQVMGAGRGWLPPHPPCPPRLATGIPFRPGWVVRWRQRASRKPGAGSSAPLPLEAVEPVCPLRQWCQAARPARGPSARRAGLTWDNHGLSAPFDSRPAGRRSRAKLGSSRGLAATLPTNATPGCRGTIRAADECRGSAATPTRFCGRRQRTIVPPRLTSSHRALGNICTSYTRATPPNHYTPHTTHRYALQATHQTPSPPTPNDATARAGLIRGRVATRSWPPVLSGPAPSGSSTGWRRCR
jgi:hypothetical protein